MHEILKKEAMAAIDRLYSDGGVPTRTTLEDMQELRDENDIKIEALQNDAADEANDAVRVGGTPYPPRAGSTIGGER